MQILQLTIGSNVEPKMIDVVSKNKMRFLKNLNTNQSIKLGKSFNNYDVEVNGCDESINTTSAVLKEYYFELYKDNENDENPIEVGVSRYSFNAYIARVPDLIKDVYKEKGLVFIELDTENITQLRYYTNMEIISTFSNLHANKIGCIATYDRSDNDQKFIIYGVNEENRFICYELYPNTEDGILFTESEKISMKMVQNLRSIVKKFNKHTLQYKYSAKVIPSKIICFDGDQDDIFNSITKLSNDSLDGEVANRDDYDFIALPEDIDLNDSEIVSSLCGDELTRTKAVILGPNVSLTKDITKKLRLTYLFNIIETEKGTRMIQVKPI